MACFDKKDIDPIKKYYEKEGIVCVKDMLQHEGIQNITKQLDLREDNRLNTRKTICFPPDHVLNDRIYENDELAQLFHDLHGYPMHRTNFPLEYREYKPHSNGMDWHRDLQMYGPTPQVEMVYTVFNNDAKTRFEWVDSDGIRNSIKPRQHDMVFVKPNGPMHRVTGLGNNTRGIIKMISHDANAKPLENMYREKKNCPMLYL